jgi:hypothetical protein
MAELWVTDGQLQAELDGSRFVEIPPGEEIEVGYWFGDGNVRIFWAKSNEGYGGLTVTEVDLRSRAHPMQQ